MLERSLLPLTLFNDMGRGMVERERERERKKRERQTDRARREIDTDTEGEEDREKEIRSLTRPNKEGRNVRGRGGREVKKEVRKKSRCNERTSRVSKRKTSMRF